MALVYVDASAVLKLCVHEPGSPLASRLWDGADAVVTSRLCDAEVRATLAAAQRAGLLEPEDHGAAVRIWDRLAPSVYLVEVTAEIMATAARLIARHPVRGADAVHLASALAVASPDLVVAVWDEHLAAAARAEGLTVVPTA
ncbi:type II toxin-antitoxin system VapC family toxin [Cellulomonas sp. P24]|uniref:type II toxin-antitoxin system VapC family toxin n=1 Tax=Cellulomonas sp. P24 TaxID=2885206 RepID=UPI00216AB684|nr:type II toxin-antitoxin system VapC family toxin [Cellulomonas sp. P24]MCR6492403.1 type II toxin-antitoxin system VapC family toxin [Cellulomonas sp. P24]